MTPDWKPAARVRASRKEWQRLREAKLGPCRVCGGHGVTLHHLVGRDLGGGDVEENLVPLCGSGTTGCHGAVEHRDPTACRFLRATLTDAELRYVRTMKGERFLDRYYGAQAT